MLVHTPQDAIKLIVHWAGRADILPLGAQDDPDLPPGLAQIVEVADKLDEPFRTDLLTLQDRIHRPKTFADRDGAILFITENQGVHGFGFRTDDPGTLLVTGDWTDRQGTRDPEDWRPLPASTADALIYTLLANGFFVLGTDDNTEIGDDFETVPDTTPVPVWQHDAFGVERSFWTNSTQTRLHFVGVGTTIMRQVEE